MKRLLLHIYIKLLQTHINGKKCDFAQKVLLLGDCDVGKAKLLNRLSCRALKPSFEGTLGVDFVIKEVNVGGMNVNLQIWDTAGQERYRTIVSTYFRSAKGVIVLFDICNRVSFGNVEEWCNFAKEMGGKDIDCILVGGNADKTSEREVEAQRLSNKLGISYIEIFSKSGYNVDECLELLTVLMLKSEGIPVTFASSIPKISPSKEEKKINYQKEAQEAKDRLRAISEIIKIIGGNGNPCTDEIRKVLDPPLQAKRFSSILQEKLILNDFHYYYSYNY